jgi:hypothetical protein
VVASQRARIALNHVCLVPSPPSPLFPAIGMIRKTALLAASLAALAAADSTVYRVSYGKATVVNIYHPTQYYTVGSDSLPIMVATCDGRCMIQKSPVEGLS